MSTRMQRIAVLDAWAEAGIVAYAAYTAAVLATQSINERSGGQTAEAIADAVSEAESDYAAFCLRRSEGKATDTLPQS